MDSPHFHTITYQLVCAQAAGGRSLGERGGGTQPAAADTDQQTQTDPSGVL